MHSGCVCMQRHRYVHKITTLETLIPAGASCSRATGGAAQSSGTTHPAVHSNDVTPAGPYAPPPLPLDAHAKTPLCALRASDWEWAWASSDPPRWICNASPASPRRSHSSTTAYDFDIQETRAHTSFFHVDTHILDLNTPSAQPPGDKKTKLILHVTTPILNPNTPFACRPLGD